MKNNDIPRGARSYISILEGLYAFRTTFETKYNYNKQNNSNNMQTF